METFRHFYLPLDHDGGTDREATIFGAVPLALATGPGAEGRTAIGIVVIGGMVLSTLLTLFVVPTLYGLLAPYTRPTSHWRRRLEEAERDSGEGPRL